MTFARLNQEKMDVVPPIEELIATVTTLTSFPDVAMKIDEIVNHPDSGSAELAEVIRTDPALTASLIRLANSALYTPATTVDSVERAITFVGYRQIRDLAYGVCAVNSFNGIPNELISPEVFWKHSVYCGVAAQHIATELKLCRNESVFTAGLLHDIGELVLYSQCPEAARRALILSMEVDDGLSTYLSEREIIGYDHCEVGELLATSWQFPAILRNCIKYHHTPNECTEGGEAVAIVHVANSIATLVEIESEDPRHAATVDPQVLSNLALSEDHYPDIIQKTAEKAADLLKLFVS
jgi:putative nucleotidyltransferase with HDIG domain